MSLSDLSCSLNPTWPDWLPAAAALPTVLALAGLLTALTLWTYLGTRGARFGRILVVMLLRLGALAVALFVALRPSLGVQVLEGIEPSRLLILVDASESMNIADDFNGLSRWDNACRILDAPAVRIALSRLRIDEQIEVVYYQGAEELAEFKSKEGATGKRTDIGTWLHELHAKHAGRDKLRGVLIFSDGADNGTRFPTLDKAREFKGICPIYTFGHGKPQEDIQRKDIAVAGIRAAPSPVPAKTKLTVIGLIQAPGFKDTVAEVSLWIQGSKDSEPHRYGDVEKHQLKDEKNNEIMLTRDAPEAPDEYKLTLKVARVEGEADDTNNEASTYLQVTKEGVSVLWVEGRNRPFEPVHALRYALGGDKRIRAYSVEITPDSKPGPARFGFDERNYDVIVIGDVAARQFDGGDPGLLSLVRDMVREKKVGLMMLGGIDTFGRGGWGKTPLAEVLPAKFDTEKQIDTPIRVMPVEKGVDVALYPFMMFDLDPAKNKTLWAKLGKLDGMASLGTIDKDAVVLAKAHDEPILVAGQYGGRVLVFGGDTTFKAWRRPGTLESYDKFWRQAILWLANQDDRAGSLWVDLKTRRVLAGSPDRLDFTFGLKSKRNKEIPGAQFNVVAEGPGNQKINIRPEPGKDGQKGTLAAPSAPGEYLLKVRGKGKDETGAEVADEKAVRFLVVAENVELQRKAPDHDHLKDISDKADGRFYHADEADLLKLLSELRGQARRESHAKTVHWPDWDRHPASEAVPDQLAGLWGSTAMLWFLAFAALLCTEWGLRRHWGMV
jgi:uncharacterized membrane protein